ncbi:unnamed protein product [Ostreobium quekettii]|uniref:Transmembrane protein 135 N-terminal domain-containing protein n=1 Tax=Ostreobium quekettii TaxID=121088 RepID=A0A8S1J131_9CHLO|nr:unnamed protein product [Ostreobium quekettii]|eukprot:evm.model.scf_3477.2 EVM.evm.TU.scf_3477.2   scf_3477:8136-13035(-)
MDSPSQRESHQDAAEGSRSSLGTESPSTALRPSPPQETSPGDPSPLAPPPAGGRDRTHDLDWVRVRDRLATAVVRGAAAGLVLRGGLHVLTKALRAASGPGRGGGGGDRDALLETARYTAWLGSLAGVFVGVDEGLAAIWGKERTADWRALVAGLCAGPTLLLTGTKVRHNSLAIYILFRGITLLIRCGNKSTAPPLLRSLLTPTRWVHGDTVLMCIACCQILHSFIFMPQAMPRSYVNFIRRHSGKPAYVWQAVRELVKANATTGRPSSTLPAVQGTSHLPFYTRKACELLHPGQSCLSHMVGMLPEAYVRAFPVYVPVYLVPAMIVHRKKLVTDAHRIFPRVLRGSLRSTMFLALFITLAYTGACSTHTLFGSSSLFITTSGLWITGLATLAEKKSRRMELALYCLSRATESFARCLIEWGAPIPTWLRTARLDIVMFSLATAAIMHCYSDDEGRHRDVFRSKYLNVLDFVFGNTGLHNGMIKHVPSNQDLVTAVVDGNPWIRFWKRVLWGRNGEVDRLEQPTEN